MKNAFSRKPARNARRYRGLLLLGTVLTACTSVPAFAQALGEPPLRLPADENGIDLGTGQPAISASTVSIGQPSEGGLSVDVAWINGAWAHSYLMSMETGSGTATLFLGMRTVIFKSTSGGPYEPENGDGSTLVSITNGYRYTGRDGTAIDFIYDGNAFSYRASTITRPNGEVQTFNYRSEVIQTSHVTVNRLQSVTSNTGYQAKFAYDFDGSPTSGNAYLWLRLKTVTLINNGVDYCNPMADSCAGLTQSWPKIGVTTSSTGSITRTVTDALNQTTTLTFDGNGRLTGVQRPSSSSNDITYSYNGSSMVSSVALPGRTTNYSYSASNGNVVATVTDGIGAVRTTTIDGDEGVVISEKDGLNRTSSYTYDSKNRRTATTYPEGNKVQATYDTRGNITELHQISKTAGTPADIVLTAGFDATCLDSAKCNQPNWTKDALGNQTDYTYDTTTGQLLTVTQPAPSLGGTQPKTTYTYSGLYAFYKNSYGNIVQAPGAILKLATASTCLTGASCAGTADERKTIYSYQSGSSSLASNLLPTSVEMKAGDSSVSSTTTRGYNMVGDVISTDGPVAGTGDTTAYRFDALRRPIGTIQADPDGGGTLPNPASRTTYDTKGRVTSVEQGTTSGQSDTAWTGFTPAAKTVNTYDGADRKLTQVLQNGSTSYGLTQYTYDARGRLSCSTVRMNTAIYGSLPTSACTLGTTGSLGKDRITKKTYDLANQVTQIERAYGTSAAATEKSEYTNNGKLAAVIDGVNNRTTYEYDGHDRLLKTRYPSTTAGSNVSSTTDYEQLTYDAASNVTAVRLRDGGSMAFTFDNLNRMTSRTPPGEPVVNFGYNLLGMKTTIQRPSDGINVTNAYDALGRLTSETQPYGSASYQYDLSSTPSRRLTWSDGHYVTYDLDMLGRVTKIRENGATSDIGVLAAYAYDSLGRRSAVSYGNGTSRSYGYDQVNRLTGLNIDLLGTGSDLGLTIGYNPASQIKSIVRSNDAYAYTARYSVSRSYTPNGLNQYTGAGGVTLSYDLRGNLTGSGSNSYTYSKLNELTSGPGVSSMIYDGTGRLISYAGGSATRFSYSGGTIIDERDNSGTILKRYVPGPGTDEIVVWYEGSGMTDRRFLQADERGSIVATSDSSGNAIGINSYDEYGIPAPTNIGRFQYTGQAWIPELGLYNYKARFYSPTLGRFMQTDPSGYADGINWYNYTGGDPINNTDSSGRDDDDIYTIYVTAQAGTRFADMDNFIISVPSFVSAFYLPGYVNTSPITQDGDDIVVSREKEEDDDPQVDCNSGARQLNNFANDVAIGAAGSALVMGALGAEPAAAGLMQAATIADAISLAAGSYIYLTEGDSGPLASSITGQVFSLVGKIGGEVLLTSGRRGLGGVRVTRHPSRTQTRGSGVVVGQIAAAVPAQVCP